MSGWHRENPDLIGTDADPWMIHDYYRKALHGPDVLAPADPPDVDYDVERDVPEEEQ